MPKNPHFSDTFANSLTTTVALANSGKLRIYDGTQPAGADTAVSTQTMLAELTMAGTAFGSGSSGVYTANTITSGSAVASGTATWFRIWKSDGTTSLIDGSVAATGGTADLVVSTNVFSSGATVSVSSLTYTFTK